MYYFFKSLKNIYLILYITTISIISILLFILNYQISIKCCELLKISDNISLTALSFGISSEVSLILTIIEFIIINYVLNNIIS